MRFWVECCVGLGGRIGRSPLLGRVLWRHSHIGRVRRNRDRQRLRFEKHRRCTSRFEKSCKSRVKSWKTRTVQLTPSTALSQPVKLMSGLMLRKLQYTTSLGSTIPRSGRLSLPSLQRCPLRYVQKLAAKIGSKNWQQKLAAKIGFRERRSCDPAQNPTWTVYLSYLRWLKGSIRANLLGKSVDVAY